MYQFFASKTARYIFLALLLVGLLFYIYSRFFNQTTSNEVSTQPQSMAATPIFNADNAYAHVEKQVNFGPRVPGTTAQNNCALWLEQQLRSIVDTVYIQKTTVTQPVSNKTFPCINIIGSFNPKAAQRVLLLAHWDSRGFADEDADPKNKNKPIDAADDGASGVAVLLEIARAIQSQRLNIGVDILLTDVEDMGKSEYSEESYCLGTQYWAKQPHVAGYTAKYAILLDMVGAKGATFYQDEYSKEYAPFVVENVWSTANSIGYSDYFVYGQGGGITDDHVFVNKLTRIPTIDIINLKPNPAEQKIFVPHWHTIQDNMTNIDRKTLQAVGQTVLQVLYNEDKVNNLQP